jgi:hypothetical protein
MGRSDAIGRAPDRHAGIPPLLHAQTNRAHGDIFRLDTEKPISDCQVESQSFIRVGATADIRLGLHPEVVESSRS